MSTLKDKLACACGPRTTRDRKRVVPVNPGFALDVMVDRSAAETQFETKRARAPVPIEPWVSSKTVSNNTHTHVPDVYQRRK